MKCGKRVSKISIHLTFACLSLSCLAAPLPKDISGLYVVDFSGGLQPDNVVLAELNKKGSFLSMGMEGSYEYSVSNQTLRVLLPDEPDVTGTVAHTNGGFILTSTVDKMKLVHKYTKLRQVREMKEIEGRWHALMTVSLSKGAPVPTIMRLNAPLTVFNGTMDFAGTKTVIDTSSSEFYIGGLYLCSKRLNKKTGVTSFLICVDQESVKTRKAPDGR